MIKLVYCITRRIWIARGVAGEGFGVRWMRWREPAGHERAAIRAAYPPSDRLPFPQSITRQHSSPRPPNQRPSRSCTKDKGRAKMRWAAGRGTTL